MYPFTITVRSPEQFRTLVHCLNYGECTKSQKDIKNGAAAERLEHINDFRKQLLALHVPQAENE